MNFYAEAARIRLEHPHCASARDTVEARLIVVHVQWEEVMEQSVVSAARQRDASMFNIMVWHMPALFHTLARTCSITAALPA